MELASTDPEIEWERYALVNTRALWIYARNKENTADMSTFELRLRKTTEVEEDQSL